LKTLQTLKDSGQKIDPSETGGQDVDTKIDDIRNQIRRSEVRSGPPPSVLAIPLIRRDLCFFYLLLHRRPKSKPKPD
jgi:hypothetical protein